MAELKHTFVKGRMNKDLDERLIPNGEYRDALNIQVSSSEGSDAGAIENILGNKKVFDLGLTNATCIGTAKDLLNKKIYWFVTSDNVDGIYEYDTVNNIVNPILIDPKTQNTENITNGALWPHEDGVIVRGISPQLQSSIFFSGEEVPTGEKEALLKNNVYITCEEPFIEIDIFKNSVAKSGNDQIASPSILLKGTKYTDKIQAQLNLTFKYNTDAVLNFDKKYFIFGANIIGGLLFFTDGLNEPRVIDIEKFKYYSKELKNEDGEILNNSTGVIIDNFTKRALLEEDISVAKIAPQSSPKMELRNTLREGNVNYNYTSFNFYKNGNLVLPANEDPILTKDFFGSADWKVGDNLLIEFEDNNKDYEAVVKILSIKESTIDLEVISYNEEPEDKDYDVTITLIESDPIYELKFPRFAYRWKYNDNTFSTFSPFTPPAFIANDFEYDAAKGFNVGATNNLRKIILSDINIGADTVKSIEILLKFDDDNNVYIIGEAKRKDIDDTRLTFEITKEIIKSTVPNLQLLRQWDNVPKKAFAQEMVGNRIIYGNYYQNYDITYEPKFEVGLTTIDNTLKKSIKSNRNYELGVVYVDKFNRQTPVLSDESAAVFVDKTMSDKNTALKVKLTTEPPAWATHFKFFIKETSAEYYNLAADRFYFDDEKGFCYISFPSAERNKITEDSYLYLKKEHSRDIAVKDNTNRYKIINISNEPPEFITEKLDVIDTLLNTLFNTSFGDGATISQKQEGSTPAEGFNKILVRSVNSTGSAVDTDNDGVSNSESGDQGIDDQFKTNLKPGNYIKFIVAGKSSKAYKIKSIRYDVIGDHEAEIKFYEPFGTDVNVIYTDPNSDTSSMKPNIEMQILKNSINAGDNEFNGRFFIKIQSNGLLTQAGTIDEETLEDGKEYFNADVVNFDGARVAEGNGVSKAPVYAAAHRTDPKTRQWFNKYKIGLKLPSVVFFQTQNRDDVSFFRGLNNGTLVKFSNHDTIYTVGSILKTKTDTGNRDVFSILFVDDDGNRQELTEDVVKIEERLRPNFISLSRLQEAGEGQNVFTNNPAIFETEPVRQKTELDIYYETEKAYEISEHSDEKILNWYNCFSFGNGVETNRIRDDFNAPFIKNGVKASTVLEEGYQEDHKFNGLIWSGIINSKSSINNSNQFIQAETITKDFLPSYGKIQKLHTWDNAMVIFLENKVLRVYANKSQLFDANGNGTLTSTNRVIGDAQEYNGEYGISNDPSSFAAFGFRCYFVDRKNGKVLRLSKDGLTPISDINMNDFFRDRLATSQTIFGSFDERNKIYNISFTTDDDTVCFSESVNGWVTRKSFVPQNAISINSKYFTFNNANLWQHASTASDRNNFYGVAGESFVQFEINEDPSAVKKFKTLSYEGSKDWTAEVVTDKEKSSEITFTDKEGKFFSNIKGEEKFDSETASNIDLKKFNFQGIGRSSSQDTIQDNRVKNILSFIALTSLNVIKQVKNFSNLYPGDKIISSTVSINIFPPNNKYKLKASNFKGTNCTFSQNGDGVTITYTHGIIAQPTESKQISVPIQGGVLILKDIDVTVTRKTNISNSISSTGPQTFLVSGKPGEVINVTNDTIKANEGFKLLPSNVYIDNVSVNSNSSITQLKGTEDIVSTQENILIQSGQTSVLYTVKALPSKIIIPDKILDTKKITTTALKNEFESRQLIVSGEEGAIFKYVLNDGTSDTQQQTITIGENKTAVVNIKFTNSDYNAAATYILTFSIGDKTKFGNNFGVKTLTFTRAARSKKELKFRVTHFDPTNGSLKTKSFFGFGDSSISKQKVSLQFTLNSSYDYSIIKQVQEKDFVFSNENKNEVSISNILISVGGTGNEHVVTFEFTVSSAELIENETVSLELDTFVNKKITLTIAYNDTNQASDYNGAFKNSLSTIQGIAGVANSALTPIQYGITMNSTFQLLDGVGEDALKADEFKLFDASSGGNDVTSTYDDNNELTLSFSKVTEGASIILNPSNFVFPNANATLTIRPSRDITESVPAVPANSFVLKINKIFARAVNVPDYENGEGGYFATPVFDENKQWKYLSAKSSNEVTETSSVANTKRLVQFVYKIDRRDYSYPNFPRVVKFADGSNSFYDLVDEDTSAVEEASNATYTDIAGNSVSVAGPYVVTNDGLTLTVNLLINIENITTNAKTLSTLDLKIPLDCKQNSLVKLSMLFPSKEQACDTDGFIKTPFRIYNLNPSENIPNQMSFISGLFTPIPPAGGFVPEAKLGTFQGSFNDNDIYTKDFTNSVIYKISPRGTDGGRIIDITDLCYDFDKARVLTSIEKVSPYGWGESDQGYWAQFNLTPSNLIPNNALFTNFTVNMQIPLPTPNVLDAIERKKIADAIKAAKNTFGFGIRVTGNGASSIVGKILAINISHSDNEFDLYGINNGDRLDFTTEEVNSNFSNIYINSIPATAKKFRISVWVQDNAFLGLDYKASTSWSTFKYITESKAGTVAKRNAYGK